jgi:hypothetical protein
MEDDLNERDNKHAHVNACFLYAAFHCDLVGTVGVRLRKHCILYITAGVAQQNHSSKVLTPAIKFYLTIWV